MGEILLPSSIQWMCQSFQNVRNYDITNMCYGSNYCHVSPWKPPGMLNKSCVNIYQNPAATVDIMKTSPRLCSPWCVTAPCASPPTCCCWRWPWRTSACPSWWCRVTTRLEASTKVRELPQCPKKFLITWWKCLLSKTRNQGTRILTNRRFG